MDCSLDGTSHNVVLKSEAKGNHDWNVGIICFDERQSSEKLKTEIFQLEKCGKRFMFHQHTTNSVHSEEELKTKKCCSPHEESFVSCRKCFIKANGAWLHSWWRLLLSFHARAINEAFKFFFVLFMVWIMWTLHSLKGRRRCWSCLWTQFLSSLLWCWSTVLGIKIGFLNR